MPIEKARYFYRLTALWAFSEALLGGLLHGLRLPVSGLILGGLSAVCISWLGRLGPRYILQAVLFVLIIKAGLSPQTPLPAYFAVSLQAVAGAFFFLMLPGYRLPSILSCVFALLQSALQKLLILTLLFGQDFWLSLDAWLQQLLEKVPGFASINLSLLIATWLGLYTLAGLGWAWLALQPPLAHSPGRPFSRQNDRVGLKEPQAFGHAVFRYLAGLPALAALFIPDLQPAWLQLIVRAFALLVLYWAWIIPGLQWALFYSLREARNQRSAQLKLVLNLLPETKQTFLHCWQASSPGRTYLRPVRMARMLAHEFQPPWPIPSSY